MEQRVLIFGKNPVLEALHSGAKPKEIIHTLREGDQTLTQLRQLAPGGTVFKQVTQAQLNERCSPHHQGVAAVLPPFSYLSLDELTGRPHKGSPFYVLLDGIEDPHNFGAIVRTAECAGAHGVIIRKDRAVSVTATVVKSSAGAVFHIPICQVTNLSNAITALKSQGIFVYGADMQGQNYKKTDLSGPICLVIGSEGKGISRLVAEKCDALISIPQFGKVGSLNASVAAGILIYETALGPNRGEQ